MDATVEPWHDEIEMRALDERRGTGRVGQPAYENNSPHRCLRRGLYQGGALETNARRGGGQGSGPASGIGLRLSCRRPTLSHPQLSRMAVETLARVRNGICPSG